MRRRRRRSLLGATNQANQQAAGARRRRRRPGRRRKLWCESTQKSGEEAGRSVGRLTRSTRGVQKSWSRSSADAAHNFDEAGERVRRQKGGGGPRRPEPDLLLPWCRLAPAPVVARHVGAHQYPGRGDPGAERKPAGDHTRFTCT